MPRFSIVTPVYNPPREAFEHCVRTVLNQSFVDWEWCLANDASPDDWVAPRLNELQRQDARIRIVDREVNGGIVAASNDAIAISSGEFLVLLDNDDELHLDALQLVASALDRDPDCDYLYSDENKITVEGMHFDAFLKPAWSPERLLAQNYTSHLSVLRRSVVEEVGRFRNGFDGSQDYDLVLRVIERARKVVHVPHVLYHWRSLPTSTASAASAKPYAFAAALKAVSEHLERTETPADVTEAGPSLSRVRRQLRRVPKLSVILPIDDTQHRIFGVETSLASNALRSLSTLTSYNNYEIILVIADYIDESFVSRLTSNLTQSVNVVRVSGQQTEGQLMNAGLVACNTRLAVLMSQRSEIIDRQWLESLLGYHERDHVAMVAPFTTDSNGMTVSAGLGITPVPHDVGLGRHPSDLGPVGMFAIARECFGVRADCALVQVGALMSVGGFDPEYETDMRDFDLACKLNAVAQHAIVTPLARVIRHVELEQHELDSERFLSRWKRVVGNDRFTRIDTRLHQRSVTTATSPSSHHDAIV
jgi:GT2 family glycosyltransferase